MNVADAARTKSWFQVLQTTGQSQLAVMKLDPGQASGKKGNEHPGSDQVLIVLEGEVLAEIGSERAKLNAGQAVTVPAGARHRFVNEGTARAVTFNVYVPPAYHEDETG